MINSMRYFDSYPFEREYNILRSFIIKDSLFDVLKQTNAMIAGGCITSLFTGNRVNDLDIYFPASANTDIYNTSQKILEDFLSKDYTLVSETDFAKTFTHTNKDLRAPTVQLIKLYRNLSPFDLLLKFDFTVCMGAYVFKENSNEVSNFLLHKDFLQHNSQRRLVYNVNSDYPFASLLRMIKYVNKGYKINGLEILKLAMKCNSIEIRDYKDLRNHMLGIDTLVLKDLTDAFLRDENLFSKAYDFNDCMGYIDWFLKSKGYYVDFDSID